jgi:hypothetical protein
LDRHDLRVAHIESALEQISCVPVRRVRRRPLETGHVQYQEAWRLTELLEHLAMPPTLPAGWSVPPVDRGMRLADPPALATLVTSSPWLKPGVSHPWGEHQMLCLLRRHLLTSPWLKPGASRRIW